MSKSHSGQIVAHASGKAAERASSWLWLKRSEPTWKVKHWEQSHSCKEAIQYLAPPQYICYWRKAWGYLVVTLLSHHVKEHPPPVFYGLWMFYSVSFEDSNAIFKVIKSSSKRLSISCCYHFPIGPATKAISLAEEIKQFHWPRRENHESAHISKPGQGH